MKNPFGESERTISAGPKKREDPEHVGFCLRVPAGKPDPHLPAYYFLCIIVYFLRPCWGADMRGRIVNYIFDVPADAGPVFPPAEEFSGFRPFRLRLLSFTQVLQIQLIDMLKHADAVAKLDVREGIVTGSQRGSDFFSFLDP